MILGIEPRHNITFVVQGVTLGVFSSTGWWWPECGEWPKRALGGEWFIAVAGPVGFYPAWRKNWLWNAWGIAPIRYGRATQTTFRCTLVDGVRYVEEVSAPMEALWACLPQMDDPFRYPLGSCEGDRCKRLGCPGVLCLDEVQNCSCHLSPPCAACVDENLLYCDECGLRGLDLWE